MEREAALAPPEVQLGVFREPDPIVEEPTAQRVRGFAREAATAALAWARRERRPERLVSYIRPGNERSVKVALALGATLEGHGDLLGLPVQVYVHAQA
jgi:RimJ/RimL family protein N-acetyltransferase